METVVTETQWYETFETISKEEINSPTRINKCDSQPRVTTPAKKCEVTSDDDDKNDDDKDDDDYEFHYLTSEKIMKEKMENLSKQANERMLRLRPLFVSQPRLETICQDWNNDFVDSGFTSFNFRPAVTTESTESFKQREDDFKYLINLCGNNLTKLHLYGYDSSQMMPLIKSNCPKLKRLILRFKEVESKDFDNVFSNMSDLEALVIYWQCKNSTLPMTLIKSLEHVSGTLIGLTIDSAPEKFSGPQKSVSSVLSPETEALMTVISNMTNLKYVTVQLDYGFTDKFFINLTNNSKNLKELDVHASNITDKGLIAVNNLHQLEDFKVGLMGTKIENKFITDQSIQCLINKKMTKIDIANCSQVTDSSIIELVKNLPNLQTLHIERTKATIELVEEITKLTKDREISLTVWVSFKMDNISTFINEALTFMSHMFSSKYALE